MSIRRKVFVIILLLFVLLGGANFLIQRLIIFPSFLELESREASENLQRIRYAIEREIIHLDRLCRDWAIWDDSYDFIQTRSQAYIESNLGDSTLESDRLNLLLFCRLDGSIVWGSSLQDEQRLPFPFFKTQKVSLDHPLFSFLKEDNQQSSSGIIDSPFGPLLFSTQTILRSNNIGPGIGYLIMARLLDASAVESLKEQTRIPFQLRYPLEANTILCGSIDNGFHLNTEKLSFIELNTGKYIQSCFGYPGITGKPVFGVEYLFPREITRKGIASMGYAAALVIALGICIIVILNLTLQKVVMQPLKRLTDHAQLIEQQKDFSRRIAMRRTDEIGLLAQSIDTMVQTIGKQTNELQLANEQLIILSVQDGLTSIANRRMFDSYLSKEWHRAMREQTPLSLILLDVDFFKHYNDTYGHQQGDRCLIAIAEIMQKHIRRPADLAARYGGEEFALILPNTENKGACKVAEGVRQGIQDLHIEHRTSDVSAHVSVSLGVSTIIPQVTEHNQSMHDFIELADQHLYQAKQSGRNCVHS
ncbi:diguanylate cyclase [Desulfobulbus rhabdoformis]|uniref:diguanylate cyclase domain-containing protein n=1 Tax=Desulfobulbus rhabdoformis TaxID=34032 RepID=UPI0019641217|nr:diguanylate cyclase [Desulfobulbus rhabdoformis]MBM9612766.1 diguanylate cyclase [Desulfobulbus rhabdoformis]